MQRSRNINFKKVYCYLSKLLKKKIKFFEFILIESSFIRLFPLTTHPFENEFSNFFNIINFFDISQPSSSTSYFPPSSLGIEGITNHICFRSDCYLMLVRKALSGHILDTKKASECVPFCRAQGCIR